MRTVAKFSLERFPTRRNRLVDKKSLQIQNAGAKSSRKSLSTFSDFALSVSMALAVSFVAFGASAQTYPQCQARCSNASDYRQCMNDCLAGWPQMKPAKGILNKGALKEACASGHVWSSLKKRCIPLWEGGHLR